MTNAFPRASELITGATIITLDRERRVIEDGWLALAGDRILGLGPRSTLDPGLGADHVTDGRGFIITPGFIDGHIHITGDPITRGFPRGHAGDDWGERLHKWTIPIFQAQTPEDEAISAQVAALAMIRYGTTTFVEAGTIRHLDAVIEALEPTGIRGRVGVWVEGRAFDPSADPIAAAEAAIALLEAEVARHPDRHSGGRLAAWPLLVGHNTNSDPVWLSAKALADAHGLRVSAHMSPRQGDPDWYLAHTGRRPLEHLADLGVLGPSVMLTHLAAIDARELDILAATGTQAVLCPHAALQGGFGLSRAGLFPEMIARGVTVLLGTDGVAADILSAGRLMASLFRDARADQDLFSPETILELMTLEAARGIGRADHLGSIEIGKKADIVLHDTNLPEWGPVFDPVAQLVFTAPPHGVHSVWIDGVKVLEAGRSTLIDEDRLLAEARRAGRAVIARTGLRHRPAWSAGG